MIDKNGKIFGKVSVVDLFALIALVAAAVFIGGRLGVSEIITPQGAELVEISFQTEQAPDCVNGYMPAGARVMDEAKGVDLGRIVRVEIGEGFDYNPDEDGNMVKSAKYGYSSVEVTSEVRGVMNERGLWVDGNRYIVGHSMSVIAGDALIFMRVSGIKRAGL